MSKSEHEHAAEEAKTPEHREEARGKRILIVEDDRLSMTLLSDFLNAHGYRVLKTSEGFEAIKRYALAFFRDAQIDWPIAAVPTCVGLGCPSRYETTYYTDYMIRYQARTYNVFDEANDAAE